MGAQGPHTCAQPQTSGYGHGLDRVSAQNAVRLHMLSQEPARGHGQPGEAVGAEGPGQDDRGTCQDERVVVPLHDHKEQSLVGSEDREGLQERGGLACSGGCGGVRLSAPHTWARCLKGLAGDPAERHRKSRARCCAG